MDRAGTPETLVLKLQQVTSRNSESCHRVRTSDITRRHKGKKKKKKKKEKKRKRKKKEKERKKHP
jgi:hypothetical protein